MGEIRSGGPLLIGAAFVGLLCGTAAGVGDTVRFAAPDADALLAEDADREAAGLAPRFAVREAVNLTPWNSGSWEELDKSHDVWTLRISARGVENLNLGFLRYELPAGAALHIGATDGTADIRPFTKADNKAHGQLWTPVVATDDLTVELIVAKDARDAVELQLGYVNLGYRPFGERAAALDGEGRSGACNVDVVCDEGDDWRDEIDSVAVISTGGSTFCTGFMVNNVEQDRTPYFMTAFHCGVGAGAAPSLVAYWNYENSTCRPPGSSASGGAGDGTLSDFTTGATLRAANSASDFTLVEFDNGPDESFDVSYSGWDARFFEPVGVVGIHHPSTDEKRISFDFDQTASTVGLTNSPEVPVEDSTHLKVRDWDIGTTEPGSSGSPIYDEDTQRVLGQLHGGLAACGNDDYDGYGRVAASWDNGQVSNSLKPWLDPNDTGAMFVDTLPANGLVVTPGSDVLSIGEVGGPFTNDSVSYTIENTSGGPLDYKVAVAGGASAPVLLNGGTSDITGSLLDGGSVGVTVSLDASASSLPAGVYDAEIVFDDLTSGASVTRVHTLEVGQTGLDITPESGLFAGGPVGGPFDAEITYQIESTRPTAVEVEVEASDGWISIDGGTASKVFSLSGVGDTATVTVGYSDAALSLPAGLLEGEVSFENLTDGNDGATRSVTLDVGRFRYLADDVPQPIESNETIVSSIFVPDDFCVADVDVVLDISHTYIGDLEIELVSPRGDVVRLHDRSGGSDDDLMVTYDSSSMAVDGPGSLDDFIGSNASGLWTLSVADRAGGDVGTLNGWELAIASADGDCPTPVTVIEENLDSDPGWARTGDWAFGTPAGNDGDPSSGATGANVFGYNLNGEYPNNMSPEYLTAGPFDFTGVTGVRLRYQRWLGVESSTFDDAKIAVSADGSSWTEVWSNPSSTVDESAWVERSVNIADVADGEGAVYVRWQMGSTDGSVTYQGWNIDDIRFTGIVPTPDCPGDVDGSGAVDLDDLLAVLSGFGTAGGDADLDGSGVVDLPDLLEVLSEFGAVCP